MPRKRPISINVFVCETCKDHPELLQKQLKEHLVKIHNENSDSGKREMVMHVDRTDSFMWQYRWEIGEVKLTQTIDQPRSGEDKRIWAAQD